MTVQTLITESGEELVVLSRRDYDALPARSGDEEAGDRMTLIIAAEARAEAPLPEVVSAAILKGDSVLKALRAWRGLTQVQLADAAGIGQGFLSELGADEDGFGGDIDEAGATARCAGRVARVVSRKALE
jgi:hypothetical protein